jgi:hypothetical protein
MRTAVLSSVLLALAVAGCSDSVSHDEVARVRSPDGKVDAVLVESNGGATTSFGYDVYVVGAEHSYKSATSAVRLYGAVRNASAYGANMLWASPSELEVQFLSAEVSSVATPTVQVAGSEISVSLRQGVVDAKAPAGGMLYNLRTSANGS